MRLCLAGAVLSQPLHFSLQHKLLYMPRFEQFFHYRTIDVSSIKELARRWYPRVYFAAPAKTGNHRALGDIRDSIEELEYYRKAIFMPNN